jgi:hypothetical protein
MADVLGTTLVSKDNDANAVTNPIFTTISDGTTGVSVTGSSLNVNITGGSSSSTQYAEDSVAVSGDLGDVALAVRQDTLSSSVSADGDYGTLKLDSVGRLWVNVDNTVAITGTVTANAGTGTFTVAGTVTANAGTGNFTVVQSTGSNLHVQIDAGSAVIGHVITDSGSTTAVTGNVTVVQPTGTNLHTVVDNTVTVSATALDIRTITKATDSIQVSANSSVNSASNPIFVQMTNGIISGEVNDFNTGAAVAAAGTSNHDYTVVTAMKLKSVICSASGKCKFTVQVGPVASLVTKAVAFVTPTDPTVELFFDPPIEIPTTSTGTVRVIRTNRENQAQDVYSTIIGLDA